jgi:hypothetical protein
MIARLIKPIRFRMAKIMVQVVECSQTNSFSRRPVVPIAIKIKAVILRAFLILGFIIAYSPLSLFTFYLFPPAAL